MTGPFLVLIEY